MSNSVLADVIGMLRGSPIDFTADPDATRQAFEAMFADVPRPEGVEYTQSAVAGVDGLWCRPGNAEGGRSIIYLHGGGYVIGSANAYSALAGTLALASNANVFVANYRLAPEHPYPAAINDVFAVYGELSEGGAGNVAVVGDSAGGGLALALLLKNKASGTAQPGSAVLWSPWVDLACESGSYAANAAADPSLTIEGLRACKRHYVGDSVPKEALTQPLEAELSGLPPLLIQVGSIEILLDDATRMASAAGAAGVHTRLDVYPGVPHVFQAFGGMLEQGRKALLESAAFIRSFA